MDYFQAIILGIIQGFTEFLPVSSSGHLVIFQKILGMREPPVFFDILVHIGTLVAIFFYFRKKILGLCAGILKRDLPSINLVILLFLGTLPAVIFGLFIKDAISSIFDSLIIVGFSYIGTAVILFSTHFFNKKTPELSSKKMGAFDAIFIGLFQALAILPGLSRSGSTISAGIFRNLDRKAAFQFSFLLSIPAIIGAFVLEINNGIAFSVQNFQTGIAGMIASAIVGFIALGLLERVLIRGKFFLFGLYCLFLGTAILLTVLLFR